MLDLNDLSSEKAGSKRSVVKNSRVNNDKGIFLESEDMVWGKFSAHGNEKNKRRYTSMRCNFDACH